MQVELSQSEVDLIESALEAWQKAPADGAVSVSMLGMALLKDERDAKDRMEKVMRTAEGEMKARRQKATLLMAKLYQATARASEHTVS